MNWNTPSNFKTHPAGTFYAVCVDVHDRREKNNFFGQADKESGRVDEREFVTVAYITFFTSEGQTVRFKANATLGKSDKPSNLRKFLKAWNAKLTDAHLDKFNPESILGWPAYITVSHREGKGGTYANVVAAMAPPPNSPIPLIPSDYIREKDKGSAQPVATSTTSDPALGYGKGTNEPPPLTLADAPPATEEDDLPF